MQAWGEEHEQMLERGLQKLYSLLRASTSTSTNTKVLATSVVSTASAVNTTGRTQRLGRAQQEPANLTFANTPNDWHALGRFLDAMLPELQNALSAYGKILLQWQEAFGLLGKHTEGQNRHFVDLHLLDSVSGAFMLQGLGCMESPAVQIVDVGSGLGLPGIPIALFLNLWRKYCALPHVEHYGDDYGNNYRDEKNEASEKAGQTEYCVFLVEPGSRKAAILRSIVVELQLQQTVCVCEHRVEEWKQQQRAADCALQHAANAGPISKCTAKRPATRIVSCRAFRPLNPKSWKQLHTPLKHQGAAAAEKPESSVQTGILLYKGAWETARAELRSFQTGLQARQACFFRLPHCGHQRSLFYLDISGS